MLLLVNRAGRACGSVGSVLIRDCTTSDMLSLVLGKTAVHSALYGYDSTIGSRPWPYMWDCKKCFCVSELVA